MSIGWRQSKRSCFALTILFYCTCVAMRLSFPLLVDFSDLLVLSSLQSRRSSTDNSAEVQAKPRDAHTPDPCRIHLPDGYLCGRRIQAMAGSQAVHRSRGLPWYAAGSAGTTLAGVKDRTACTAIAGAAIARRQRHVLPALRCTQRFGSLFGLRFRPEIPTPATNRSGRPTRRAIGTSGAGGKEPRPKWH